MSTADHSENGNGSVSEIAAQLRDAGFVRFVTMPDGDSLAATGVLARILDVPVQASITRDAITESEADVTVAIGRSGDDSGVADVTLTDEPIASKAVEVAQVLDETETPTLDPNDAVLTLAGIVAAESEPETHPDILEIADIEDRPGVGVPIDDLTDGLAHTTLVHAPFSGDWDATDEALAGIADDDRTIASMLALSAASEAETQASTAIKRAIHPYVLGTNTADETTGTKTKAEMETGTRSQFATLAGYADVLDTLARSRPGIGLALALGYDCYAAALDGWREHAGTAHAAVHAADLVRYHGLSVAQAPDSVAGTGTVETVARLIRDYHSLEPIVLAIAGGEVAGAATDRDITAAATHAATAVDGRASGRGRYMYAQLNNDSEDLDANERRETVDAFIDAFQEVL